MVECASKTHPELRFRIVTGDDTQSLLDQISPEGRERLEIITGNPLSDETIQDSLRSSVAVTILQRRVMQSGSLPIAMMNGTPVLVTPLRGLTQFVEEGQNGRIVGLDSTPEERLLVLQEMVSNLPTMSQAARRYYEDTFDSRNVASHIPWLLGIDEKATEPALPAQE